MNEENLSNLTVIKRSGKRVTFDGLKIAIAIKKGFDSIEGKYDEYDVNKIYNKVIEKIQKQNVDKIKIDEIQDMIEEELKENGYEDVYLSFSEYREKRNQSREIFFEEKRKHKFLKALEKLGLTTKENGEITYNIEYSILSSSQGSYSITDENGKRIGNRGYIGVGSFGDSNVSAMVKYDKDTKIYFRYRANTAQNIYPGCSYIKIEAMEYLAIDPLQYVDNVNGTQDTPVGTIISVMGNNAPKHYLKCDGITDYLVKDYPYLAEYFKKEFGSVNKFGGDGVTTFRTPDLKGEFLRGTGVNGHANQGNGAAVGTHQDATALAYQLTYTDGKLYTKRDAAGNTAATGNPDFMTNENNAWSSQFNPRKCI